MDSMPALRSLLSLDKFLLLLFFMGLAFSTSQTFFRIRARNQELDRLQEDVSTLGAKAQEMEAELEYRRSPEFVYKEALEQLGYTRAGEVIVVLPDFEERKKEQAEEDSSPAAQVALEPLPYWKQWRDLFFGN